jgi:hypothetical protein
MGPQVQAMVQQAGGKRRRLATKRRRTGSNGWAFESTAQPIAAERKPFWQAAQPLVEAAPSNDSAPLAPGEKRESKTYRQRSLLDIVTPLAWAGVSSTLIGLASVPIVVAKGWEWFWPPVIWLGSGALFWFIGSRDFLDDDKLITSVQEMSRQPEPTPIVTQPQPVNLEFYDEEKKKVARGTLRSPSSNAQGLAEYADALLRGTALPSMDGGKDTNGARAYGYNDQEFEQWRSVAVQTGQLKAPKKKGQPYTITPRGRRSFERIARLELESMSYGT